jgi:hypothetical protein
VAEAFSEATDCSGALDGVTSPIADGVREAPRPGGGVKAVAETSGGSCLCWLRFAATSEGVAGADRSSGPPSEVASSDAASDGVAGADFAASDGVAGADFTTGDLDAAEGGAAVAMGRADRRVMSSMTVVKLLLTASVGLDRI